MSKLSRREALAIGAMILAFVLTLSWTLIRIANSASHGITFYDAPVAPLGETDSASSHTSSNTGRSAPASPVVSRQLVVHVAGAVRHPGVYRLPVDARIDDAVRMAGGPAPDANTDAINLAAHVEDGTQIYLPTRRQQSEEGALTSSLNYSSNFLLNRGGEAPSGRMGGVAGHGSHQTKRQSDKRSGGENKSGEGKSGEGKKGRSGSKLTDPGQGTVNINTASAEELQRIPGIGPSMASRIIALRQDLQKEGGRFQVPEDLRQVSGIGEKKLEKMLPFIRVK